MIEHHEMRAEDTSAEALKEDGDNEAELVLSDGKHVVRLSGSRASVLMLIDRINDRVYGWRNP